MSCLLLDECQLQAGMTTCRIGLQVVWAIER